MGTYRHEMETARGTLQFHNCTDYIDVFIDGKMIGRIWHNEGDWEAILGGDNPIDDGWEDGHGNRLAYDGWGKEIEEEEEEEE